METPELETLLGSEKKASLSLNEKRAMKAMLLEHASKTSAFDTATHRTSWFSWRTASALSFASIFLAFIGTAYASTSSLPGDPLYALKVNVTEEIIGYTKLEPIERASYDITLLETRLEELKMLSAGESISDADLSQVAAQIREHIESATSRMDEMDTSTDSHTARIDTLARLGGVVEAHDSLVGAVATLAPLAETIDTGSALAEASLAEAVQDFASDDALGRLEEYLSDQISEVGADMGSASLDPSVQEAALDTLYDADESLAEGDAEDALLFVLDAQRQIAADQYLEE